MESVSKKKFVQRSDVYAKDQTLQKKSASKCRLRHYYANVAYGDMQRQVGAPILH